MIISEEALRDLIRHAIIEERYLTLPTRGYNSWQWYSSGGDIAEDEIDEDEEETLE